MKLKTVPNGNAPTLDELVNKALLAAEATDDGPVTPFVVLSRLFEGVASGEWTASAGANAFYEHMLDVHGRDLNALGDPRPLSDLVS